MKKQYATEQPYQGRDKGNCDRRLAYRALLLGILAVRKMLSEGHICIHMYIYIYLFI